ncbi:MAG: hypothetical protein ACR650_00540 [Methylocystis sp.]
MQILIELIKLGAVGASLAFLILSYWLLQQEIAKPDPRVTILHEIRGFRVSALLFFLAGVSSELGLTYGGKALEMVEKFSLQSEIKRVRFYEWSYHPERDTVSFGFDENRTSAHRFIPSDSADRYSVIVGIRQQNGQPPEIGAYPLAAGPFPMGRQSVELNPSHEKILKLGNRCVEYVAFGVKDFINEEASADSASFTPSKYSGRLVIFNTAAACLPEER